MVDGKLSTIVAMIVMMVVLAVWVGKAEAFDSAEFSFGPTYSTYHPWVGDRFKVNLFAIDLSAEKFLGENHGYKLWYAHKSQFSDYDDLVEDSAGIGYFIRFGSDCGR